MEDRLFGQGNLRRTRILKLFRNYDVDPNMHPDGTFEAGRLEKLISDPNISMDNIRRAAQAAAHAGLTNTNMQQTYPNHLPVTMSDPRNHIDTSFSFDGEQVFNDGPYDIADNLPFEPTEMGEDLQTLLRREEEEGDELAYETDPNSEIPQTEQMLEPDAQQPIQLPEENITTTSDQPIQEQPSTSTSEV